MSDEDLRNALLGTWRLISIEVDVDGTHVKPLGDNPQGYLVYTPDGHVFVQFATRDMRNWHGPEVLELPLLELLTAIGFLAYCGTFEVRDGQVIHYREFGVLPSMSGNVEPRSVTLDGDRLILGGPIGAQNVWRRIH